LRFSPFGSFFSDTSGSAITGWCIPPPDLWHEDVRLSIDTQETILVD